MSEQNSPETSPASGAQGFDLARVEAMVAQLSGAIVMSKEETPDPSVRQAALRAEYMTAVDFVKLMSDIRFRCLAFVTAVIAVANALLPGTGDPGTRVALGFVGFLTTLGIAVYELRNSQLYEAASHRAKTLEGMLEAERTSELSPGGGLFSERTPYVDKTYWKGLKAAERLPGIDHTLMRFWAVRVKHDRGLALIYGAVLGGWVYLIAGGLLALPPPLGLWGPAPAGLPQFTSGVIGLCALVFSYKSLVYHDENRFRPSPPGGDKKVGEGAGG
ncbi:MAG: hypothetical protein LC795_08015 [Acidobacteria bacterium]|nr:hypothetical protein [Acidobacteriota bacterium]